MAAQATHTNLLMKAPEQTHQAPERGTQYINYSMLPPDKLPNWLLEKQQPPKIYNYSMDAPGTQPLAIEKFQERELPSHEVFVQPPHIPTIAPEPIAVENVPAPESIPDTGLAAPASVTIEVETPLSIDETPLVDENALPSREVPVQPASTPPAASEPIAAENVPAAPEPIPDRVLAALASAPVAVEAPPPPAQAFPAEPFPPAGQPEYPFNTTQPPSKSFTDWILNNSNTSMIIVVGIILFAIVLIVLLMLGIV